MEAQWGTGHADWEGSPWQTGSRWYCYIGHVRTYRDPGPASKRRPRGQRPRGGQGARRGRGPAGCCPGGFVAWQPAAGVRSLQVSGSRYPAGTSRPKRSRALGLFFCFCSFFLQAGFPFWPDSSSGQTREPRTQGTTRGGRGKGQGTGIEEYLGSEAPRKKKTAGIGDMDDRGFTWRGWELWSFWESLGRGGRGAWVNRSTDRIHESSSSVRTPSVGRSVGR